MRRLKNIVILLTLALMVIGTTGCALNSRINKQMASWVGHNSGELVTRWGPPTETQDIGGGQRVLTWRTGNGGYRMFRWTRTA
jgi:hypothetical protein